MIIYMEDGKEWRKTTRSSRKDFKHERDINQRKNDRAIAFKKVQPETHEVEIINKDDNISEMSDQLAS